MANILFASNNRAHFPTAVSGSDVAKFDASRVRYSIDVQHEEILNSPVFAPASGEDTWFHIAVYYDWVDNNGQLPFLIIQDEDNNRLAYIVKERGTSFGRLASWLYDGTTQQQADSVSSLTRSKLNTVDVHYHQSALKMELKVYMNTFLVTTLTINTANPNGYGKPVKFQLGQAFGETIWLDTSIRRNHPTSLSEIIVADDDTRNARLNVLVPVANGNHTDWGGLVTELSDDDRTSGMTALTGGLRQTAELSDYIGAANISNVVMVSTTTRGPNSPTKMKHSLRMAGVDYDSAEIPLGHPLQYNITDWKTNPATTRAWKSSDLDSIEAGFLSVT